MMQPLWQPSWRRLTWQRQQPLRQAQPLRQVQQLRQVRHLRQVQQLRQVQHLLARVQPAPDVKMGEGLDGLL